MPFMASVFSNDTALREQAKYEGVLREEKGAWWITDHEINQETVDQFDKDGEIEERITYSDTVFPSSKIYEMSFKIVPNCLRVSTMIYPNSFLNVNNGIVWMRSLGIDVDVFTLTKFSAGD